MAWLRIPLNALLIAGLTAAAAVAASPPADEDAVITQSLAEMLRDARTVISNNQDLINNPELGDKHLSGQVVLEQAVKGYAKATGKDPTKIDPNSRQGRLLRAMMASIVAVTDDNQATINENGTGFKGFIPAVFARLVSEDFNQLANGRPAFRVTVPEYYAPSCLVCHGSPKGEMDLTGYPKEGGKTGDLGAVISITLYH